MRFKLVAVHNDGRKMYANSGCKRCYGRGYVGFARKVGGQRGEVYEGAIPCRCMQIENPPKAVSRVPEKAAKGWMEKIKVLLGAGEARKRAVRV